MSEPQTETTSTPAVAPSFPTEIDVNLDVEAPSPDFAAVAVASFLDELDVDAIRPHADALRAMQLEHAEAVARRDRIATAARDMERKLGEMRKVVAEREAQGRAADRLAALAAIGEAEPVEVESAAAAERELDSLERQHAILIEERSEMSNVFRGIEWRRKDALHAMQQAISPVLRGKLRTHLEEARGLFHLLACWLGVSTDPISMPGIKGTGGSWTITTHYLAADVPTQVSVGAEASAAWLEAVLDRVSPTNEEGN